LYETFSYGLKIQFQQHEALKSRALKYIL